MIYPLHTQNLCDPQRKKNYEAKLKNIVVNLGIHVIDRFTR